MADRDNKSFNKKPKPEPSISDSPIKAKQDLGSTMDMILKKLAEVHDLAKSTKANTDSMQLELTAIRADMNNMSLKICDAEQRISDVEDTTSQASKEIKYLHNITSDLRKRNAELEDRNRRGNI